MSVENAHYELGGIIEVSLRNLDQDDGWRYDAIREILRND